MPPVIPDPARIRSFPTEAAFEKWLAKHHDRETELWLRIYKKDSGVPHGDLRAGARRRALLGLDRRHREDASTSSPSSSGTRRADAKSMWSQINREHVARLTAAGRMTPHGQQQVDAAKADGRWDAAYAPIRETTEATVPADLRAAIAKNRRAQKTFETLGRMNLFALAFRTNNMKTPAGRARKIAEFVEMLERGDRIVPEPAAAKRKTTKSRK